MNKSIDIVQQPFEKPLKAFVKWKCKFYKNLSKDGGSMDQAILDSFEQENLIVLHSHTKQLGRCWGVTTQDNFAKILLNNYGLYEVLCNYPKKMYFDVDKKNIDENDSQEAFLKQIKAHILTYFPNAEMAISGSYTKAKWSFHIVLNNYIIKDLDELLMAKNLLIYMNKNCNEAFDNAVYTKNRNMKCINQSKLDGRIQAILENNNVHHHLITCFINKQSLTLSDLILPEEIKKKINVAREKSNKCFDIGILPDLNISKNIDDSNTFEDLTPIQILALLPIDESFHFAYTALVGRFCYYNGLALNDYVAWLKKKHPDIESEINKYVLRWNSFSKFPDVHKDKIKPI
jgi:hypothetical protein